MIYTEFITQGAMKMNHIAYWDCEAQTINTIREHETPYYGIWVQEEDGHFWIMDAYGGDEYVGVGYPTARQIQDYRDRVIQVHG